MVQAIRTTFRKGPSFFIYPLAWWLDDQGDFESTISVLLRNASVEYGVQVRVMLWSNYLMKPLNPKTQKRQWDEINQLPTGACIQDTLLPTSWRSPGPVTLTRRRNQTGLY